MITKGDIVLEKNFQKGSSCWKGDWPDKSNKHMDICHMHHDCFIISLGAVRVGQPEQLVSGFRVPVSMSWIWEVSLAPGSHV